MNLARPNAARDVALGELDKEGKEALVDNRDNIVAPFRSPRQATLKGREHPVSKILGTLEDAEESRRNQRINGSINNQGDSVDEDITGINLEALTRPARVYKTIRAKKRRRRHNHHPPQLTGAAFQTTLTAAFNTSLAIQMAPPQPPIQSQSFNVPPPPPPPPPPSVAQSQPQAIEVDDGFQSPTLPTPASSLTSLLDDMSDLEPLLPSDSVTPRMYYQELLDSLVSKRALYEAELLTAPDELSKEKELISRKLARLKEDLVVLVRRRDDFKFLVKMKGMPEQQKLECLSSLAKNILRNWRRIESEDIALVLKK